MKSTTTISIDTKTLTMGKKACRHRRIPFSTYIDYLLRLGVDPEEAAKEQRQATIQDEDRKDEEAIAACIAENEKNEGSAV